MQSDNKRLVLLAVLAAQAVVLSLIEHAIPTPFVFAPGAKLGLANIITLIAIYKLPLKDVAKLIVLRLLLVGFMGGTLSMILFSLAGAILSFIGMAILYKLGGRYVSVIGISVTGAALHNVGQLIVASIVAGTWTVLLYLPVLTIFGIASGFAIGVVANYLLQHMAKLSIFNTYKIVGES